MYEDIIQRILDDNDDVIYICKTGSRLYGYNTENSDLDLVVYTSGNTFKSPKRYLNTDVWFFPLQKYFKNYPFGVVNWAHIAGMIYCIDDTFVVDAEKLMEASLLKTIDIARAQEDDPVAINRFANILKNYKETGTLDYHLSSIQEVNVDEIFNDPFFNTLQTDYITILEFQTSICQLLLNYGGNIMFSDYSLQSLQYVLAVAKGETPVPVTAVPTEKEAAEIVNYCYQVLGDNIETFEAALDALNIEQFCAKEIILNAINLGLNFFLTDGDEYLDAIVPVAVEGEIFSKAIAKLCAQYILRGDKINDYKDYMQSALEIVGNKEIPDVAIFKLK